MLKYIFYVNVLEILMSQVRVNVMFTSDSAKPREGMYHYSTVVHNNLFEAKESILYEKYDY